ncbi:hypothetical protein Pint_09917 [Pistacia integerrima]|uniref:Uncharacterized protein n=1 Tax=Pistacia integerrima TaxID=434235 RepID=A0ACC0XM04_9ROSI|nr:hypothetical protein Pint_09917 [Pistacia integerrima]
MASSSFSNPAVKHDVFFSYDGRDTFCLEFSRRLRVALVRKQIAAFFDLPWRSDEMLPSLLNAIECSKISVIIFSEAYASSKFSLEELVKILESRKIHGQIVIPVFYDIVPSDVEKLTGTFGDGFAKLQELFKESPYMLQRWSIALTEAANISGFHSNRDW